jgi:hypothetical protein
MYAVPPKRIMPTPAHHTIDASIRWIRDRLSSSLPSRDRLMCFALAFNGTASCSPRGSDPALLFDFPAVGVAVGFMVTVGSI